ncbi:transcription initiation factor IID, 31kD subunit-domain-containing protein [Xylariaceae sp. FL0662B]|nr:transcription initiation factor IID, 31kD subunit-domain-containing protein [Xylariaceae sp. FL0662B]
MATASQSQPNGIPSSSGTAPSQPPSQPTQHTAATSSDTIGRTQQSTATATATAATAAPANAAPANAVPSPTTTAHAPRPRDARTLELLLTSQGVTSFDSRVPLLLLDFAYRHTSSILNDALHLSTDPYTSHAGARPSGASGAVPAAPSNADAAVSANAVHLAIASRQAYQFRGGGAAGGAGAGASKDWLQELARERNRVALPRVLANEWGVRLPNERFVLSGMGWGLKDQWSGDAAMDSGDDEDEDEDEEGESMEGLERHGAGQRKDGDDAGADKGDGGGGLDELLAADEMGDEDMDGMEE